MIRSKEGVASLPMTAEMQGMGLAAMVGLVVEEMIECGRKLLLDIDRIDEGAKADGAGEVLVAQAFDIALMRASSAMRAARKAAKSV